MSAETKTVFTQNEIPLRCMHFFDNAKDAEACAEKIGAKIIWRLETGGGKYVTYYVQVPDDEDRQIILIGFGITAGVDLRNTRIFSPFGEQIPYVGFVRDKSEEVVLIIGVNNWSVGEKLMFRDKVHTVIKVDKNTITIAPDDIVEVEE